MSAPIFNILKRINTSKEDWDLIPENERKAFNPWLIHRFLSMNPDYIEVVNIVQKYQYLTDKQVYTIYKNLIPKRNVFLKYIKGKKDKTSAEDIKYLADYFECSTREIKEYIDIVPKEELANILDNFKVTTSKKKVKK
jgi:hypothetical protein